MKTEVLTGVIQKDATVLAEDNTIHSLPIRGIDKEGYPEVLINAKAVGLDGYFYRQSIKKLIGATVDFVRTGKNGTGYDFIVTKLAK